MHFEGPTVRLPTWARRTHHGTGRNVSQQSFVSRMARFVSFPMSVSPGCWSLCSTSMPTPRAFLVPVRRPQSRRRTARRCRSRGCRSLCATSHAEAASFLLPVRCPRSRRRLDPVHPQLDKSPRCSAYPLPYAPAHGARNNGCFCDCRALDNAAPNATGHAQGGALYVAASPSRP